MRFADENDDFNIVKRGLIDNNCCFDYLANSLVDIQIENDKMETVTVNNIPNSCEILDLLDVKINKLPNKLKHLEMCSYSLRVINKIPKGLLTLKMGHTTINIKKMFKNYII
jgi:hypothetical protein